MRGSGGCGLWRYCWCLWGRSLGFEGDKLLDENIERAKLIPTPTELSCRTFTTLTKGAFELSIAGYISPTTPTLPTPLPRSLSIQLQCATQRAMMPLEISTTQSKTNLQPPRSTTSLLSSSRVLDNPNEKSLLGSNPAMVVLKTQAQAKITHNFKEEEGSGIITLAQGSRPTLFQLRSI